MPSPDNAFKKYSWWVMKDSSFSIIFTEAVYSMALFGNVFHTNYIIFNLLPFLCLEDTARSLCCALLLLMRVYVLPWLLRGCQSPGCPSWDLCKSWSFASLCQGATCPISPISVKLQVNGSVNSQKVLSQGQSTRRKGSYLKSSCPSTQAVWWDLKGS